LDAALSLYGSVGWLGFNLDAIARSSKVSKDAVYRRWKTREALLEDALKSRWDWLSGIDTGDIRADLVALAARTFDTFAGVYGEVALQLHADSRRFAEVRVFAQPNRALMVRQGRAIVRRAIERGELSPAANPGIIMDLLIGSVINHIVATPEELRGQVLSEGDTFVKTIVDVVLSGVHQALSGCRIAALHVPAL
jgi:AcrR family transcriptional regulator